MLPKFAFHQCNFEFITFCYENRRNFYIKFPLSSQQKMINSKLYRRQVYINMDGQQFEMQTVTLYFGNIVFYTFDIFLSNFLI